MTSPGGLTHRLCFYITLRPNYASYLFHWCCYSLTNGSYQMNSTPPSSSPPSPPPPKLGTLKINRCRSPTVTVSKQGNKTTGDPLATSPHFFACSFVHLLARWLVWSLRLEKERKCLLLTQTSNHIEARQNMQVLPIVIHWMRLLFYNKLLLKCYQS